MVSIVSFPDPCGIRIFILSFASLPNVVLCNLTCVNNQNGISCAQ